MRPTCSLLLGLLPCLSACAMDYGVSGIADTHPSLWQELQGSPPPPSSVDLGEGQDETPDVTDNTDGEPEIDVRLDAAFQRNHWGRTVTRCQVQLSFSLPNEAEVDEEAHGNPIEIARPEEPGQCAFTEVDPDSLEDNGGGQDNWYVSGGLSGPDEVLLVGDTADWTLELTQAEDGKLRYELVDCDVDTFPFGQALDLVVPSAEADLDAFEVSDALAIGSEVVLTNPGPDELDANGRFNLPAGASFDLHWETPDGEPVLADGELADRSWELRVQNEEYASNQAHQWLYCQPDAEGAMQLDPEHIALFEFNAGSHEESVETHVDLHLSTEAPQWETPWGRSVQVRTTISDGGPLYLDPGS